MLKPQAFRQRLSLDLTTSRDIYSPELVENFLEDLIHVTDIKQEEVIVLSYYKVGLVSIDILSKAAFLPSEILNVVEYWFAPKEVDIL